MTPTIVRATPDDIPGLRELQAEAVRWLAGTGTGQWQPTPRVQPRNRTVDRSLEASIARGEVYVMRDGDELLGTLVLDDYADPEFWTDDDKPDSALYVHRMIVARKAKGRSHGAVMLDWAADETAKRGRPWLRLDAWRTNRRLQDYYQDHGFTLIRAVKLAHRGSGALFQRPRQQAHTYERSNVGLASTLGPSPETTMAAPESGSRHRS